MEEIKVGDSVRLTCGVRTWDGTLWPKGAVCKVLGVQVIGLRLGKGLRRIVGVPFDAVELAGKDR